jgi:hypothetical protein
MSPIEDIIVFIDAFERKPTTKDIQVADTRTFGIISTRIFSGIDSYPCG